MPCFAPDMIAPGVSARPPLLLLLLWPALLGARGGRLPAEGLANGDVTALPHAGFSRWRHACAPHMDPRHVRDDTQWQRRAHCAGFQAEALQLMGRFAFVSSLHRAGPVTVPRVNTQTSVHESGLAHPVDAR